MKTADGSNIPSSLQAFWNRLGFPEQSSVPAETLLPPQSNSTMIEDFRPLFDSLETRLARLQWHHRGTELFSHNEVPFVINNTGLLSQAAAVTLFMNCEDCAPEGVIRVCEYAAGSGLFARYCLDTFRAICAEQGRDYYDRLVYIVSDVSPRTLEQWSAHGIFEDHADHVWITQANALNPGIGHKRDGSELRIGGLRAVFLNYALDVLPSAVLRVSGDSLEQLMVRTHLLNDPARLKRYTHLNAFQIAAAAASPDPEHLRPLVPLVPALDFESAWLALTGTTDEMHVAAEFHQGLGRFIHNHGPLTALSRIAPLLNPAGFVLINDYGPTSREQIADHTGLQRFGSTIAACLNFPYLDHRLPSFGWHVSMAEGDAERPVHSRLLMRDQSPDTINAFLERFSQQSWTHLESAGNQAREHARAGRKNEALESYRIALSRYPRNWALLGEAAEYAGLQLREFVAGIELAKAALELNPWYSAWLWNILGDCLYCIGKLDEAHAAYLEAAKISPKDPRTNLNLAYTLLDRGEPEAALAAIATGFAHDAQATYRSRLADKQAQIMLSLNGRWIEEAENANRRTLRLR